MLLVVIGVEFRDVPELLAAAEPCDELALSDVVLLALSEGCAAAVAGWFGSSAKATSTFVGVGAVSRAFVAVRLKNHLPMS